jgi:hypothetical protein
LGAVRLLVVFYIGLFVMALPFKWGGILLELLTFYWSGMLNFFGRELSRISGGALEFSSIRSILFPSNWRIVWSYSFDSLNFSIAFIILSLMIKLNV